MDEILNKGDRKEIRALFSFDSGDSNEEVIVKFCLWSRWFFPNFFKFPSANFHKDIDNYNLAIYRGQQSIFVNVGFRGCAKTSRTKLFRAFVIANDRDHIKKYLKIAAKDLGNAKQIVTDIYNMLATGRVRYYYPEIFRKTEEKRQETMGVFDTASGVKVLAVTVGMDQRGQLQDESRPDEVWFEDVETRNTLRSAAVTETIWNNMQEAITGLSKGGGTICTCNYISERGNIHKLITKYSKNTIIVPIKKDGKPTWPDAYTIEEINKIEENAEDFSGEYMCEPSAGADVFFDRSSIDKQMKKTPVRTIADFKIFHPYVHDHRYGLGADVAGGVGLDSSTTVIIDFSTMPSRVVATFANNLIKPDTFGDEIKNQADRFGAPIVAVENNKFDMCIGRLKQIYDNLYFTEVKETRVGLPPKTRTYGWNTNFDSKNKMLSFLKRAVEDGHLELSDENLIAELRSYTRDDLMDKDEDVRLTTRHFDLLIACSIAYMMRNFAEYKKDTTANYVQPEYQRSGLE